VDTILGAQACSLKMPSPDAYRRSPTAHELPVSAIKLTLAQETGSASGVSYSTYN